MAIFESMALEVAGYVAKGLNKGTAIDELYSTAQANGLVGHFGEDGVQARIAHGFEKGEHIEEPGKANGVRPPKPLKPLPMINVTLWEGVSPPERRWIVRNRIPARNVTLFSGEGGVGKTLLTMQLAVATVLGRDWIGELPEPGPVMFITAEDDEDEIHFRMTKIVQHYGTSFRALGDLHFLSLAGKDAVMAVVDGKGIVRPTPLFAQLQATARVIRPRWIGLDTAADIFICDERNRTEARQCIGLLRGLCLEIDTAILLLSHPSLSGIASGSGMSGSTAWNNSVRSRLYLKAPNKQGDEDDDESDVRVLETMKANYGPKGEPIRLVWKDGLLLTEPGSTSLEKLSHEEDAKAIFLAILERYNKQDLTASATPTARNFAPTIFADQPEAKALHAKKATRKHLLRAAMDYLMFQDKIYQANGPQSKPKSLRSPCLYKAGQML
jgi:RecA-family ATPase